MVAKRKRRGWTIEDMAKRGAPVEFRWLARVRDTKAAKYRNKVFRRRADAVAWCKEQALVLNRPRLNRFARALAIQDAPWETLVAIAREICDRYYPADIFTGSSGDVGPQLIAALRGVMDAGEP